GEGCITLTLRRIKAEALTVEVPPSASVAALLQRIALAHGYAAEQVVLIKDSAALDASKRLADYPSVLETRQLFLLKKQPPLQPFQFQNNRGLQARRRRIRTRKHLGD